jgi:two-component system, LytTR family, response regulator
MSLQLHINYTYPPNFFNSENRAVLYFERGKTAILIEEIVLCQGVGNYTFIQYKDGRKKLFAKTLKDFCELFESHCFVRISKAYLINLKYLKEFSSDGELCVVMSNEQRIDISRRRRIDFQIELKKFAKKKAQN